MSHPLDVIFKPETIAIIGASNQKNSVGEALLKNLVGSAFTGTVFPVNPRYSSILGIKAYPSVKAISVPIDLAVIATPASTVPKIVKQCGEQGIKGILIISAGFKEAGESGEKLTNDILKYGQQYGMRIIGPNCLGYIKPSLHLNVSFSDQSAHSGKIAFISQSGALCTAILDWAWQQKVGFSHFVSIGSMADIGFHDLIDYFGNDPETSSMLIYMESLNEARKFLSAARNFARNKPIIILKAGKSQEGAHAALSHTGSLAGNDEVFNAAFRRAGIVRVNTIGELFDCAETLAKQNLPEGSRLGIITNAGGPGVIATDFLMDHHGQLASLSENTIERLNENLPEFWSHGNPVDILGDAGPERYKKAIEIVLNDENVDGLLVILTPQAMTDPEAVANHIVKLQPKLKKPLLTSWMGEEKIKKGMQVLEEGNFPVFNIPESGVATFLTMVQYKKNLDILFETPASIPETFVPAYSSNKKIVNELKASGRTFMSETEAKKFLRNYGIPIPDHYVAQSSEDLKGINQKTGFPWVMKIVSPDLWHKTDIGGVKYPVNSLEEANEAFREIQNNVQKNAPQVEFQGILVEPYLKKQYELLIGGKRDPIFGPYIIFGMGGVSVEIFKDTAVGLPPLNMALALQLIQGTKIYQLLKGYRGLPGVDIQSLQFLLYKFSYLLMDFPEISEIDINPFAVDEIDGAVLDAKINFDFDQQVSDTQPYRHLVISPYPREMEKSSQLKNGRPIFFRPVKPEDEPLMSQMFSRFSPQTQRFRFFETIGNVTHQMLARYTQIDYDREIAIVAEITGQDIKEIAGVGRLIMGPDIKEARFAIVVADPWQRQGLGNQLMDYILEIARKKGVHKVYASLVPENIIMLHMFKKRKFQVKKEQEEGLYFVEKEIG